MSGHPFNPNRFEPGWVYFNGQEASVVYCREDAEARIRLGEDLSPEPYPISGGSLRRLIAHGCEDCGAPLYRLRPKDVEHV